MRMIEKIQRVISAALPEWEVRIKKRDGSYQFFTFTTRAQIWGIFAVTSVAVWATASSFFLTMPSEEAVENAAILLTAFFALSAFIYFIATYYAKKNRQKKTNRRDKKTIALMYMVTATEIRLRMRNAIVLGCLAVATWLVPSLYDYRLTILFGIFAALSLLDGLLIYVARISQDYGTSAMEMMEVIAFLSRRKSKHGDGNGSMRLWPEREGQKDAHALGVYEGGR